MQITTREDTRAIEITATARELRQMQARGMGFRYTPFGVEALAPDDVTVGKHAYFASPITVLRTPKEVEPADDVTVTATLDAFGHIRSRIYRDPIMLMTSTEVP